MQKIKIKIKDKEIFDVDVLPGSPNTISPASKGKIVPSIATRLPLLSISTCCIWAAKRVRHCA